ncbi:MAG: hypothetical protein JSV16_09055 [Candidatus Hydrogenedentota bacterium]|nr:MAG: hypothetical protein JSV16_09055 [Candidatus Hydrogenedentota bacterium]
MSNLPYVDVTLMYNFRFRDSMTDEQITEIVTNRIEGDIRAGRLQRGLMIERKRFVRLTKQHVDERGEYPVIVSRGSLCRVLDSPGDGVLFVSPVNSDVVIEIEPGTYQPATGESDE